MGIKRQDLIDLLVEVRPTLSDNKALKFMTMYPHWSENVAVKLDERYQYEGKLYRCKQEHTTQSDWTPDVTASLWDVIDVEHSGTIDDPIPYDPNMVVYNGKYYTYDNVTYLCIRDSGQPLYTTPDTLINNYFEVVS